MKINTKYQRLMKIFEGLIYKANQAQKPEEAKGFISEQKTARALHNMKTQHLIKEFIYVGTIEEFDKKGKDFLLAVTDSQGYKIIPLQVKSSTSGMLKHLEKEEELKKIYDQVDEIPVVVVYWNDSDYDIQKKIESRLNLS